MNRVVSSLNTCSDRWSPLLIQLSFLGCNRRHLQSLIFSMSLRHGLKVFCCPCSGVAQNSIFKDSSQLYINTFVIKTLLIFFQSNSHIKNYLVKKCQRLEKKTLAAHHQYLVEASWFRESLNTSTLALRQQNVFEILSNLK